MSEYVFKLPDLGEGTVESEIGEWFIKVGDEVAEEDLVGTMMTDKAAVELSSPVTGKVVQLAGEPGDLVAVGAALVIFDTADSSAVDVAAVGATSVATEPVDVATVGATSVATEVAPKAAAPTSRVMTSPAVRRKAKEAGLDLAQIAGTGPGGRVTRMDFEQFIGRPSSLTTNVVTPLARAPEPAGPGRETTEIKVIGLRRIIAERMAAATREIPHFTYVEEIDVTELESLRKHLNDKAGDKSARLTLLPFLGLALIRTLRDFPQCNATYDKERNLILQHGAVHLGIATQTPDGLKVPVVHNADSLSIDELGSEIRRVSEAARNNTIRKDELSGSTITITSLGKLGGIVSTPVINMPEVSIIGVNRAVGRQLDIPVQCHGAAIHINVPTQANHSVGGGIRVDYQ